MVEWFPIARGQLEKRLRGFAYARVAIVTAVLLVCWELQAEKIGFLQINPWTLHVVFVAAYVLSLLQLEGIRRKLYRSSTLIGFQIFTDICVVTGIVQFTGYLQSPFAVLYVALILSASVLLTQTAILLSAVFSSLSISIISALNYQGWLTDLSALGGIPTSVRSLSPVEFWSELGMLVLSMYVAAFLGAYLSKSLRFQRDFVANLAQDLSLGLVMANRKGRITFMNRASERMLGKTFSEASGQGVEILFPAQGINPLAESLRTGHPLESCEVGVPGDEEERIIEVSTSLATGGEQRVMAFIEDVSRMKALEEEVRLKDKLATIGEAAAGVAHEIRNPLASIRGSAKALAADDQLAGGSRRLADLIVRESDRLAHVVTSFLNYAKISLPAMKPADLGEFLSSFAKIYRDTEGRAGDLNVQVKPPDEALPVFVDPEQMHTVLFNLLRNAAEAGARTVRIEGRRIRDPRWPEAGAAEILISDDGPGIPSEIRHKVFSPFFTTRPTGTGLGLALVQRIVNAHAGKVFLDSSNGQGVIVGLRIPCSSPREVRS